MGYPVLNSKLRREVGISVAVANRPRSRVRSQQLEARSPLTQLPDGIEHGAVDPFHHGDRAISQLRPCGLAAADALDFSLDVLNGTDWQARTFHRVQQILAAGIDRDAALGDDDVDQFAGAGESGDFIDDHGNAVAE